jgi:transcriptional regulator of acetoin/glycerol metabolism
LNDLDPEPVSIRVGMTLKEAERVLIFATLAKTNWQIKQAAAMLGIDRGTLYDKMRRYGIERGDSRTRPRSR